MSYLGLDIGTGSVKAAVYDRDGHRLALAYREYAALHPQKYRAELDSREVIRKSFEVIREVNASVSDPVTSMSISSQGEAFTPVGADGEIIGNAMISSDSRALEMIDIVENHIGKDELYRITGHTPYPIFTLYKLLWMKIHQPETWKRAAYFLCFEDLLHLKLGLTPNISWSLAGRTMMFDVNSHEWSERILEILEIGSDWLARPARSGMMVGRIDRIHASDLGFTQEVMVVAGGHDQTCAALGAGVLRPGTCMYATGTVECFCPVLSGPVFSEELKNNNLCCYDYTLNGYYTTVAYSLTGGNILRWFRDEIASAECQQAQLAGEDAYHMLLEQMPEAPSDLMVLPYFSPSGTPYFDPFTRGAILGLQQTTSRGEIIKALLEGVTFEMKLNLQIMQESGMKIDTFIATGGGTRNDKWSQLKADILNKRIVVRDLDQAGCFGAALLARSTETGTPVEDLPWHTERKNREFYPDQKKAAVYDEKFMEYRKLYPLLKQFWKTNKTKI